MMASKNYIIYKIVCDDDDFIYVGSTGDFNYRKRHHKNACNNEDSKDHNQKLYTTIRENGGWENWRMIQIHQMQNVTKREAEATEEEYRVEFNANLNGKRAFLFPEVRKELKSIKDKKYKETENGKAVIKAYNARRYVCDCGKEICVIEKNRHEKTQFHLNYIKEQN
tara:strand:+ start:156 stop:656 length:501 start_codon:yes stop_codon:yes gene_type:complete